MSTKLSNNEIQERLKKEAEQKLAKKTKQLQDQKEVKK
jgi:hypothetical protein